MSPGQVSRLRAIIRPVNLKKTLWAVPALLVVLTGLAWAGELLRVECTQPICQYSCELPLGGARLSPAITCYCPRCRDFVRLTLQNWSEYHLDRYHCPQCGRPATPVYSIEQISAFPCPKCGKKSLKAKTLKRFD
jgi:ribosomal protein S27AE